MRRMLARAFDLGLRGTPPPMRGALVRLLLKAAPTSRELSLAGRAIPHLRSGDHLPVLDGPLRGARWLPEAGLHACVEGTYEPETQEALIDHVHTGDVVFDVGANAGYFTLLGSRLVGPAGRVVAFEPLPRALELLRRHVALNALENVQIVDAAVSDRDGEALFRDDSFTMGRLTDDGDIRVRLVALDPLCAAGELPLPDVLKIDVEGAELDVLEGARGLLTERHPVLVLSTHGRASHEAACELLSSLGYRHELIDSGVAGGFDYLGELLATAA
jgi:FkbM family methyltransferase